MCFPISLHIVLWSPVARCLDYFMGPRIDRSGGVKLRECFCSPFLGTVFLVSLSNPEKKGIYCVLVYCNYCNFIVYAFHPQNSVQKYLNFLYSLFSTYIHIMWSIFTHGEDGNPPDTDVNTGFYFESWPT